VSTGSIASAYYRATLRDCLPLEKLAIEAAATEASRNAALEGGTGRLRSIGVLGPYVRSGACGRGVVAFPLVTDRTRFTQSVEDVKDPTIVMDVSVGITFDR